MVTTRRVAIPTPATLALQPVQQAINNVRERLQQIEAATDVLTAQVGQGSGAQQIAYLQTQVKSLANQIALLGDGSTALAALLTDSNGIVVLRSGALLTRRFIEGSNITISSLDGSSGDITISATGIGGFAPLTTGEEPMVLVSDGEGQSVLVPYP